jgi:integrase
MKKKKPFIPKHLLLRHNTYFCVLTVPKDLREQLGIYRFSKTTNSKDLNEARIICSLYVVDWKKQIEDARVRSSNKVINSALELRTLLKTKGHIVENVIDEESERVEKKYGPVVKDFFKKIAKNETKLCDEFYSKWLDFQKKRGLKEKTIKQQETDLKILLDFCPTLDSLNERRLTIWARKFGKSDLNVEGLTASSITRIFKAGSSFYRYLRDTNVLDNSKLNPFVVPHEYRISRNPNSKSINKQTPYEPFTDNELKSLYEKAKKDDVQLANLIKIASYTGARIEELCSLRCDDVNLKKETITFTQSKTKAGERTIPIHKKIKELLSELIDLSEDDYVFSGLVPNKYSNRSNKLGKQFKKLKESLDFHGRVKSFHSIRKTFTTKMENLGVTENITADIVGHQKKSITYGLYSGGNTLGVMKKAINKLHYNF